jgi:hypothetical protein
VTSCVPVSKMSTLFSFPVVSAIMNSSIVSIHVYILLHVYVSVNIRHYFITGFQANKWDNFFLVLGTEPVPSTRAFVC